MIELINISKTYGAGETAIRVLNHVNLTIAQGDFVAIMGPSGSGKSTLMSIMGCLDNQYKGEYWFNQKLINHLVSDELAEIRNQKIGFVFQSFHLLPRLTVKQNIELPAIYAGLDTDLRKKRTKQLMERVGLEKRKSHLPGQLSGGQRQRVAIARALINQPDVIIADEPTGNLDSKSGTDVMQLLKELNQSGVTIVLITHDSEIAKHANQIYYIRDGMISEGVPEVLYAAQ